MAKILLISANLMDEPYPVYPLGMTMVAEAVRAQGHEAREFDLLYAGEFGGRLSSLTEEFEPDIIGISIRNIDNTNSAELVICLDGYRTLVENLRAMTGAPIVLGGAGYSLFPEALLEETKADYGIVGEGERVFCDLVEMLSKGVAPSDRILSSASPLKGGEIAAANRNPELAEYYLKRGGMLNLQTRRGCPHRCVYCTYPALEGGTYRFRAPEDVADEIEMLVKRQHADYYSITDSVFNDQEGEYLRIAEEIVKRGINIPWMAFFRPGHFTTEEVNLLKKAGLSSVEWGTDASTDETLEGLNKDFTWNDVEECARIFSSSGIANAHFVIFGGPGETQATLSLGLANIERLERCVVFAFNGIRILPKTPLYTLAMNQGIISGGDNLLNPVFYFSPDISREMVHENVRQSFGSRPDRVYPPGKDTDKVRAFHRLGYRGPIWDLLLGKGRTRTSAK